MNYQEEYNDYWSRADRWGSNSFKDTEDMFKRVTLVSGRGSVLDVGCGMGLLVRTLLEHDIDAQGVDIAPRPVEENNRLNPGRFQLGSILELPYADNAWDTVVSTDCLEHIAEADVPKALAELHRVARRSIFICLATTRDRDGRWHLTIRDREWWERQFFAAGFRRHPLDQILTTYAERESDEWQITLSFEKIPAAALQRYPLAALQAERDLHMDMTREPGRRSDAHIARYIMARRYLPKAGVVLDAACGLGYGSAVLGCMHPDVKIVGLDNSDYAVDYARACFKPVYSNLDFQTGDACELSRFADESIDLVVSFETVEHLKEPEKFLAEIRRVLKPGGRFVCSVPNMWVDEEGKDPNPWHFHVFDFAKLAQLCTKFFPLEHVYRQTAGGGMTLNGAPRELLQVNLPVVEGAQDAEWWLVAAAKPSIATPTGARDTILALTADTSHPLFSSWLPATGRPVATAQHAGVDFVFPENTALVVANDCYREPYVTLLRRAVEEGLPTLVLADGILEYRNTWDHPQLAPGAIFQPVLGHKIACLGRSQARILEAWGNIGRCEVIGAPRFDRYAGMKRRSCPGDAASRVLVMTAMTPYFTETQHALVRQSLLDLKATLADVRSANGQPVEVIWRVTNGLERELQVASVASDFTGRELADVLQQVDAVITTPSTAMLEAMLLGLPVAVLDYCNVPAYVPSAWRITAAGQIAETLSELLSPSPARMLYQDTVLHDALECTTSAAPRLVELAERMIQQVQVGSGPLRYPARLVPVDSYDSPPVENRFQLAQLYPDHAQFLTQERSALQVEIGQLRRQVAWLEGSTGGVVSGDTPAEQVHRLLALLPQAKRSLKNADHAAIWEVKIGATSARAIVLHPPNTLVFTVPTGRRGRLTTAIGIHPDMWEKAESGACEFSVRVDGRVAFAAAIDALKISGDRRWHEIVLEIPDCSAGKHEISLSTKGLGSQYFRWALWREPRFACVESDGPSSIPMPTDIVAIGSR